MVSNSELIQVVEEFLKKNKSNLSDLNNYLLKLVPLKNENSLINLIKIYLMEYKDFNELKKSELNKRINIKDYTTNSPEFFYFLNLTDNYYSNLIRFNPNMIIDDLVIEYLYYKNKEMKPLYFILKNRNLNRSTLKLIFDNLVFLETLSNEDLFYKYGILNKIINYYKISDKEQENINKDNVKVLSNLIWENLINIYKARKFEKEVIKIQLKNSIFEHENLIQNLSESSLERILIVELLNTIVTETDEFFYNRLENNKEFINYLSGAPNMLKLEETMERNFKELNLLE